MVTTLQGPRKKKEPTDGSTRGIPWKTILFNCDCHSFEEVAHQLMKAIRVSFERGMEIANVVHTTGSAIVYSGPREHCEAVAMVLEDIGLRTKVSQ